MPETTIKISYHFDGSDVITWYFFKTNTAQNMGEYGFSLTHILPYKDKIVDFILIRENNGQ